MAKKISTRDVDALETKLNAKAEEPVGGFDDTPMSLEESRAAQKDMKEVMASANAIEVPISDSEECEYTMPGGYKDGKGVIHKTFTLRQMTGVDEEAVSHGDVRSNVGRFIRITIERVLTSIGTFQKTDFTPKEWRDLVQSLYSADGDYIFATIQTKNTEGTFLMERSCPECSHNLRIEYNTEHMDLKPFKGEKIAFALMDGVRKGDKIYKTGFMRVPTMLDREEIGTVSAENYNSAFNKMLARLLLFDNYSLGPIVAQDIQRMSTRDRRNLTRLLREEATFGLDNNLTVVCENCEHEFKVPVSAENFT